MRNANMLRHWPWSEQNTVWVVEKGTKLQQDLFEIKNGPRKNWKFKHGNGIWKHISLFNSAKSNPLSLYVLSSLVPNSPWMLREFRRKTPSCSNLDVAWLFEKKTPANYTFLERALNEESAEMIFMTNCPIWWNLK